MKEIGGWQWDCFADKSHFKDGFFILNKGGSKKK